MLWLFVTLERARFAKYQHIMEASGLKDASKVVGCNGTCTKNHEIPTSSEVKNKISMVQQHSEKVENPPIVKKAQQKPKWSSKNKYLINFCIPETSKSKTKNKFVKKKKTKICSFCDKIFESNYNLEMHLRTHTEERPFTCSVCDSKFKVKYHLERHMFCHNRDSNFVCPVCDKKFSAKQALEIHLRSHSGDLPFACKICNKKFSSQSSLNRHMEAHDESKTFLCSDCGKTFGSNASLKQHELSHLSERNFHCSKCRQKFKKKIDLNRHQKSHQEIQRLPCPLPQCEHQFKRKDNLIRHLKLTHNLTKEEANNLFDSVNSDNISYSDDQPFAENEEVNLECIDNDSTSLNNTTVATTKATTANSKNSHQLADNSDSLERQLSDERDTAEGPQKRLLNSYTNLNSLQVVTEKPSVYLETENVNQYTMCSTSKTRCPSKYPTSAATSVIRSVESLESQSFLKHNQESLIAETYPPPLHHNVQYEYPISSAHLQAENKQIDKMRMYRSGLTNDNGLSTDSRLSIPVYHYSSYEPPLPYSNHPTSLSYTHHEANERYKNNYIRIQEYPKLQANLTPINVAESCSSESRSLLDLSYQNREINFSNHAVANNNQFPYVYNNNNNSSTLVTNESQNYSSRRPEHFTVIRRASPSVSYLNTNTITTNTGCISGPNASIENVYTNVNDEAQINTDTTIEQKRTALLKDNDNANKSVNTQESQQNNASHPHVTRDPRKNFLWENFNRHNNKKS